VHLNPSEIECTYIAINRYIRSSRGCKRSAYVCIYVMYVPKQKVGWRGVSIV
jgi:hypothetical protein